MKKDIDTDEFSHFLNTVKTQFVLLDEINGEPFRFGVQLDRAATNKLLRELEKIDSTATGYRIMLAQLRDVLKRKDWLLIDIAAETASLRKFGVSLGIIQAKIPKIKSPRPSPLQKWQQRNFLNRRSF